MATDNDIQFPEEMVDLDAIVEHPKLLIFSKPKAGKTTLISSDDNVLILNAEGKSATVSAYRSKTKGKNIKQVDCSTWAKFVKMVDWLQELERHEKKIPFNWVAVDTLTTLQDRVLMRYVLDEAHAKNARRSLWTPDKPDYGVNQSILMEYVKRLNDLPVNVIYTAHIMTKSFEGQEFFYPQIQGGEFKVAQAILAMMTSYGFMYAEPRRNDKGQKLIDPTTKKKLFDRFIQWDDEGMMQGGDRLNIFGSTTKNVTLKQIRQRIEKTNQEIKNGTN